MFNKRYDPLNALLVVAMLFVVGCGSVPYNQYDAPAASGSEALRNAQFYLESNPGWNIDCSNFVRSCFRSRKMDTFLKTQKSGNLTMSIYRYLRSQGVERAEANQIEPGDILIFNYTYDANKDGSIDSQDVYTHSGIAEIFRNGVLTYIDSSKGRSDPKLRRRSFSFILGGKNEKVATDPKTGRIIRHKDTYFAAFKLSNI